MLLLNVLSLIFRQNVLLGVVGEGKLEECINLDLFSQLATVLHNKKFKIHIKEQLFISL